MPSNPWSNAELDKTVARFAGVGSDDDAPDAVRFVRSVTQLVWRRAHADEPEAGIAYFLLRPPADGQDHLVGATYKRCFMLDHGTRPVSQKIWFVNCVANDGYAVDLAVDSEHVEFRDLLVDAFDSGTLPTVVVDTQGPTPIVRYFPQGLMDIENSVTIEIEPVVVDLVRVGRAMDSVVQTNFITPEVQNSSGSIWARPDRYHVASDAEFQYQNAIKAGLAAAFPLCIIRSEQTSAEGRHDLLIEEHVGNSGSGSVKLHFMIELKVIRSRNTSGTSVSDRHNKNWLVAGVRQAYMYARGRNCQHALLAFLDAREPLASDACLQQAKQYAERVSVNFLRHRVYGTSSDYREASSPSL